jgi:hypothetical protein
MSGDVLAVIRAESWAHELKAAQSDMARVEAGVSLPQDADLFDRYGASRYDSWGAEQLANCVSRRLRTAIRVANGLTPFPILVARVQGGV